MSCFVVPSDAVLKWSHPETWKDVEKGWGGFNCSIPGPGEDVIILPSKEGGGNFCRISGFCLHLDRYLCRNVHVCSSALGFILMCVGHHICIWLCWTLVHSKEVWFLEQNNNHSFLFTHICKHTHTRSYWYSILIICRDYTSGAESQVTKVSSLDIPLHFVQGAYMYFTFLQLVFLSYCNSHYQW